MLNKMAIRNLTVFSEANLDFGGNLNVFVGKNGTGKTHLLELAYSVLAVSAEEGRKINAATPTKSAYQTRLADKLVNVFRPETLDCLARRKRGRERCDIQLTFEHSDWDVDFGFATNSKSEVSIEKLPKSWLDVSPVYLSTRELLTIFPNFVAIYAGHYLKFDETWRDTCLLLGTLLKKGSKCSYGLRVVLHLEQPTNH
ncbi:ATP-binding protein [Gammaproteobacteria bacterium]